MITDDLYVEAMWALGFFLFVLLLVQTRCRCDFARACSKIFLRGCAAQPLVGVSEDADDTSE